MRLTNGTSLLAAPLASRNPVNRPCLTIALKGSFRYADGEALVPLAEPLPLSGDVFRDDDAANECLYASDFAPWKPRTDLFLSGACHVPGGRPTGVAQVRFGVGQWSKTLAVFGPRNWQSGGDSPGLARPFTKQELSWRHAFGGPGWARNPVGRGYGGEMLPEIELDRQQIRGRAETPPEAGFGPLNPDWPQRAGKRGTYDGEWLKQRWPGFPADFDWSFFNAAPEDQQLPGYLRGDEAIVLENLHADAPLVRIGLPGWRVRCFAQQLKGNEVVFLEIPLALDTLSIDTEARTLALVWRGQTEVRDDELDDVLELVITAEDAAAPAGSAAHFKTFATPADELVRLAVANGTLSGTAAPPPGTPGAPAPAAPPAAPPAAAPPAAAAPAGAAPAAKGPGAPPAPTASAPPGAPPPVAPPAVPTPPSLGPMALGLQAGLAEHRLDIGRVSDAVRDLAQQVHAAVDSGAAPPPWPGWPEAPPPPPSVLVAKARAEADKISSSGVGGPPEVAAALGDTDAWAWLDQLAAAGSAPEAPLRLDPPTADEVMGQLARGESLAGKDLSGADLGGQNLAGGDLSGAVLKGANLSGAQLAGANLAGAVLVGARLDGAALAGAKLGQADLAGANLVGADLSGADLAWCNLTGADLTDARLVGADATCADLTGANLTRANLTRATLKETNLSDTTLDGARLTGADLTEAMLHGAHGEGADLSEASVDRVRAGENVRLTRCRLVKMKGADTVWHGAVLDGSDLSGVSLRRTLLTKASLVGCQLIGADLAQSSLRKASLARAVATGANFFQASLARADLTETNFSGANLYGVEFLDCTLKNTLFENANLKMTTLASA